MDAQKVASRLAVSALMQEGEFAQRGNFPARILGNLRTKNISVFARWRRRRDLNPRDPFGSNGFQDRRFQPLTHSSVFKYNLQRLLAGRSVTILEAIAAIWCTLSPNCQQNIRAAPKRPSWIEICANTWLRRPSNAACKPVVQGQKSDVLNHRRVSVVRSGRGVYSR